MGDNFEWGQQEPRWRSGGRPWQGRLADCFLLFRLLPVPPRRWPDSIVHAHSIWGIVFPVGQLLSEVSRGRMDLGGMTFKQGIGPGAFSL